MNKTELKKILLPSTPRDFHGRRLTRSALRALHILGGGVLIGAYLFNQGPDTIHSWLLVTVVSGTLLFSADLHASMAILFEWRGMAVIIKISLLLLILLFSKIAIPLLVTSLFIGALSSHLSRKFRHRLWLKLPGVVTDKRHG